MTTTTDVFPPNGPAQNIVALVRGAGIRVDWVQEAIQRLQALNYEVRIFTSCSEQYAGILTNSQHMYKYTNLDHKDVLAIKDSAKRGVKRVAVIVDGLLKMSDAVSRLMDLTNVMVVVATGVPKVMKGRRWAWRYSAENGWVPHGLPKEYVSVPDATDAAAGALTASAAESGSWLGWLWR